MPTITSEDGEDILDALRREIREETGSTCDVIHELGYIYENRAYCNLQQYSCSFAVTAAGPAAVPAFTSE